MDLDRAVRLRELWNGSFNLSLLMMQEGEYRYILWGIKANTPPNILAVLVRLSDHLHLTMKVMGNDFWIF